MATISEALAAAVERHRQGRLQAAEQMYRQILQADPNQPDALHLLGVIAHQLGKHETAVEHIARAIQLKGYAPEFHTNLARVYHGLRRMPEAVEHYRRALELRPDFVVAHNNLGNALRDQGMLEEAVACFHRALELDPDFALAHNNVGNALRDQGKLDDAVACYHRSLALAPDFSEAMNNLGLTYRDLGKPEDAAAILNRALQLAPNFAMAHNNLGNALKDIGKLEEAIACYRRALALDPGSATARFNLALRLLQLGRYEEGWTLYESRPALSLLRNLSTPRWHGERAEGETILLQCEQGFGDALQFLRYAPLVRERARAVRVIVECQAELARLFTHSLRGEVEVIPRRTVADPALPQIDWHLPLLSAPLALGVFAPLPMTGPYLHADPALRTIWKRRLGSAPAFRVGLAWKGSQRHPRDRARSISFDGLLPLLEAPGVCFHSLQIGADADERAGLAAARVIDLTPQIGDFADTAAIVAELDLVISVDTAVAHLAGGMGRPVWTLLSFAGEWRWGIAGESTPWYPSMRLFRQASPGDWKPVLRRVAEALASLARPK